MNQSDDYQRAYQRERLARAEAERILEEKSAELYELNEALKAANDTLVAQQAQMIKTEKMASLGSLAAGIAHEVNNPLAFVLSNINALKRYSEKYIGLTSLLVASEQPLPEAIVNKLSELQKGKRDIGYIVNDTRLIFSEVECGLERVRDIVSGLKRFARTQPGDRELVDVNECIEQTLKLLENQLKYKCKVNLRLRPVPEFYCNANELSQVFLNLIINASHAVQEQGTITITSDISDALVVTVEDDGHGIPADIIENIFDPFFTNKPIGEGTGLGLSVSHGIIESLGGDIRVTSDVNQGTCFTISLPLEQRDVTRES